MFEDLEDEEFLDDEFFEEEEPTDEENGNRTFVVAAIVLGALTIIAIVCLGVYLWSQSQPVDRADQATEQVVSIQELTEASADGDQAGSEEAATPTPLASSLQTQTPEASGGVSLEGGSAEGVVAETPDATATVAALLTQAAGEGSSGGASSEGGDSASGTGGSDSGDSASPTATTAVTELPETGLFDDYSINNLILLAAFALVVIFLARRLRTVNR